MRRSLSLLLRMVGTDMSLAGNGDSGCRVRVVGGQQRTRAEGWFEDLVFEGVLRFSGVSSLEEKSVVLCIVDWPRAHSG